jgi:hypothetical protein
MTQSSAGIVSDLQATYNDLLALQDQTDHVPLTTALDAVGAAIHALNAAATPSMRDALTIILAHPVDMDERPIRGDVSNEKCFWLRVSGKDYTAAKDALTGTLAQASQDWKAEAARRFGPIPSGGGENTRLIAAYHYAFVEGAKAALAHPSTVGDSK